MMRFLRQVKFAWEYFILGRHRLADVPTPPDFDYGPPDETLMRFLEEMFIGHGARAFRSGSWVVVDRGRLFIRAVHFRTGQNTDTLILQTDFVCVTSSGRHIVESFAGIGTDLSSALIDACKSFQDSSFHVLFVTLLGRPCDHVDRETWCVDGTQREMIFGCLRSRGKLPHELWPPVFEAIQRQIEAFVLPSGLHWVRYFYAHVPDGPPTIEVLVDNQPCDTLISKATDVPWPSTDAFYSARLFFTIQDAPDATKLTQSEPHP